MFLPAQCSDFRLIFRAIVSLLFRSHRILSCLDMYRRSHILFHVRCWFAYSQYLVRNQTYLSIYLSRLDLDARILNYYLRVVCEIHDLCSLCSLVFHSKLWSNLLFRKAFPISCFLVFAVFVKPLKRKKLTHHLIFYNERKGSFNWSLFSVFLSLTGRFARKHICLGVSVSCATV